MNGQGTRKAAAPNSRVLGRLLPWIPATCLRELAAVQRSVVYEPGEVVIRPGERGDPGVVIRGLLRHSVRSPTGRQATLQYIKRGGLFGWMCLVEPMPHTLAAFETTTVVHFDREVIERLTRDNSEFAVGVGHSMTRWGLEMSASAAKFAFLSVEQRVDDHLTWLATAGKQPGSAPVARVTQQQLADAVGTAREVVARILPMLKAQGRIGMSRGAITLLERRRLARSQTETNVADGAG